MQHELKLKQLQIFVSKNIQASTGVLDPCLSWNDHVDYIGRRVSAELGMLCRARKVIPRESCDRHFIIPMFDY